MSGQCEDPNRTNTQFQYVPEDFKAAHPELDLSESACVCKEGDCRRWCELQPEKQKPGRRPAKAARLNDPAVGVAIANATHIPEGYKLIEPAEIWGFRSPMPACALTCACHCPDTRVPSVCARAGPRTLRR